MKLRSMITLFLKFYLTLLYVKDIHTYLKPDILYVEHSILDFYEDKIEKLGSLDLLPPYGFLQPNDCNNYNLVIRTPNYYKYKDNHTEELKQLDHKNTMVNHSNGRTPNKDDVMAVHTNKQLK